MPNPSMTQHWTDPAVLADTISVADGELQRAATAIDGGQYPLDILGALGRAGAMGVHLDRHGARFGLAIAAMEATSRACGSTGFLLWCQDVCGLLHGAVG